MRMLNAASFRPDGSVNFFDRYAPWIITGVSLFYAVTFPIHHAAILVVIPVAMAAWLYRTRGGWIASGAALILDYFLVIAYDPGDTGQNLFTLDYELENFFLLGHLFVLVAGLTIGRLRQLNDSRIRIELELRERNRYLSLLNEMTRLVITAKDFNLMMANLVKEFAVLLNADACYLTRWDATQRQAYPIATTSPNSATFLQSTYPRGDDLTTAALREKNVVHVPDYAASPYAPSFAFAEKTFYSIPLIYGEHQLGAVIAGFNESHQISAEELKRAKQAGDQVALALWNTQQDLEYQRSLREQEALSDIALALSETESIGLNNVLQLIVNSAKDLIANAEQSVIHLYNEKDQTLTSEAVAGFNDPQGGRKSIRLGEGIAGQVITSGETVNISDVNTDPRFVKLGSEPTYRSLMVAPVHSGKHNLGTISIQSNTPYAFSPNDNKLISQLGTQAAIAIENANLLEKTQQALKEANALYRINRGLVASLDPDDLLQDTVELLQKNFGYYYVQVFVANPDTGNFIMRAGSGDIGAQLKEQDYQLPRGEGIVGYTAETGDAFFTNDVDDAVSYVRHPLLPDTKAELAVPVKVKNEILGLLDIHQAAPKRLSQRDVQLVSAVADQLAIALQRADLYENLQISLQQEKVIRGQMMQNERLTVMGRLLATVSHELNNPLQAIQNALFLLKEEQGISDQGRQDLEIVLAESERMSSLIERLRATYRPAQSEDLLPTQINKIVEDTHALISTHLRHNHITFENRSDPELPVIYALSDQIRQVVLNLFMNACEAMPEGGKLSVSTEYVADAREIMLAVADTGTGIPAEILPIIFEAFVTNKASGTGLGLTISYDIVQKHRGRIIAENNPEFGATFKVWLPLNDEEKS